MSDYMKIFCPKKNNYGLLTIDGGVVTNFQPTKKELADSINNNSGLVPTVSIRLLADALTGTRVPNSVDKTAKCVCGKNGDMTYQCLFCSAYQVPCSGGPFDIYFLMDESGSMSMTDRKQAVDAIRNIIVTLSGMGNHYFFMPWGTEARFIFANETDGTVINNGLELYHKGKTGLRGRTCADRPFEELTEYLRNNKTGRPAIIIFVTDGGFENPSKAKKARNQLMLENPNTKIFAVGIAEAKKENIDEIATEKDLDFGILKDSSSLGKAFGDLASLIKKYGGNA